MISEDINVDLLRHMEWADSLILSAVLSSQTAAADAVIHDLLYHTHVTQHAFLQVWQGTAADLPAADSLDIKSLARWAQAFYSAAMSDTAWMKQGALGQTVPEELLSKAEARLGAGSAAPSKGDTVIQVVMHSTYHRGQVCRRLREVGSEVPLTEYFLWVWRGRPSADWASVDL